MEKFLTPGQTNVGDLFFGTGAISAILKRKGCKVHANDYLEQCKIRAKVILLLSGPPLFNGLKGRLPAQEGQTRLTNSTYLKVLSYLNQIKGFEGFFYSEYSPKGSRSNASTIRKYFIEENAMRIDAIRYQIKKWKSEGAINDLEHSLLLVNLIEAVNRVANISGTYGYFLKKFQENALRPLSLKPFSFIAGRRDHIVTKQDVFEAAEETASNVVYLDPPFTKRQYPAYYHVLETIAMEDTPKLIGKTGMRPWKERASVFCYKYKAKNALEKLIEILWPRTIFLSYSSDGHIQKNELLSILENFGPVTCYEYKYRRFKSNNGTHMPSDSSLKEYLFCLEGEHDQPTSLEKNH
jgi:adenine-specific DNA-methyltransferase